MNLTDMILAADDGAAAFVVDADPVPVSFGTLRALVERFGSALRGQGIAAGDRIAYRGDKSLAALALGLGVIRIGAIYMPVSPSARRAELDYLVADAAPAMLVVDRFDAATERLTAGLSTRVAALGTVGGDFLAVAGLPARIAAGGAAPAILQYTSGTTGRPKGALLSHDNLLASARALIEVWAITPDDRVLHALPLSHGHGLFLACHVPLAAGASVHLLPRFDVDRVVDLLPLTTILMGVPTFYTRLLGSPRFDRRACANQRLFIAGSAPLPIETIEAVRQRTGITILERYGTSETSISLSNPPNDGKRPGTVGTPVPGTEFRLRNAAGNVARASEVGEIEIRGPAVFGGYWNRQSTQYFAQDGFFRTGDLGRADADGYVTIVGRLKDMIISGGLKIYPAEVEQAIRQIDGVVDTAVIGVPHPDFGETPIAIVVADPLAGALDEPMVIDGLRALVAAYKLPRAVRFVEALPVNALGKVLKTELRTTYGTLFVDPGVASEA